MSKENNKTLQKCKYCKANFYEEKKKEIINPKYIITVSAIILTLALYFNFFTENKLIAHILFIIVAAVSGFEIVPQGIRSLLKGKFSISFLITIAAVGAFVIGEEAEGASVIFLFFIAEYLEDYAGKRAIRSIGALILLTPETAIVKRGDKNIQLHAHAVETGETVIIKPGDKIPLDGVVVKGISSVNQATITGESVPLTKKEGDTVFAGTLNEEGYLEVKVTKRSDETVLSKIIEMVKDSHQRKSRTEAFIDRFSNYYTPTVIILAFMVVTIPPFIFGLKFDTWFYRSLVLLVVSCPCALAISTPVSMISGITAGTNNGVLIKGGEYIEEMQNVKTVVFDKTGTLTQGRLEVTDLIALNENSKNYVLQVAASLESKSKHPLAEAIIKNAGKKNIKLKEVNNFESVTGKGIKGNIDTKMFYVGKKGPFENNSGLEDEVVKRLQNEGKTIIFIGNDDCIMGLIGLMDKIRPGSSDTIKSLKKKSVKTVMLTGDNEGTARAVSAIIGIDNHYAGLLPQDKVQIIEELLKKDKHVAMVGDGVNDAPALARASIGIAMGTEGSDAAIETADVTLMHDDITKINYLITLSKKTMAIVRQNISLSILVKGSFAAFAVLGLVSLWMAVAFGDMGLTLAVILNALRIGNT